MAWSRSETVGVAGVQEDVGLGGVDVGVVQCVQDLRVGGQGGAAGQKLGGLGLGDAEAGADLAGGGVVLAGPGPASGDLCGRG
nr:hypothetical protein GCM10025730_03700 [Promicromonospora thailandica]